MASTYGTPAFNAKHGTEKLRARNGDKDASPKMWDTKLWPFLDCIRQGMTVNESSAKVGVEPRTPYKWEERYPKFRIEWDRVRAAKGREPRQGVAFDAAFRQRYFGLNTPMHLQKLMDGINEIKRGKLAALYPPFHAKSSLMEDYVCWLIATNPNIRIKLVSKSQKHAKKMLFKIKNRLTNRGGYADFIDDFGPFKKDERENSNWTTEYITVARRDSDERDYTVEALGIGGQIYGNRADVIILDDIADLKNQTAQQIDDMFDWLRQEALSRLDSKDGKLLIVGTRVREDDIYGRMEEENFIPESQWLKFPAQFDDGTYLWPEYHDPEWYEEMRQDVGPRIWELAYQQNPLPTTGSTFPFEAIESCFDDQRSFSEKPSGTRVVVGMDPAASGFTAGVALAFDPKTHMRYLLDVWNEENLVGDGGDRIGGLVQLAVEMCRKYHAEAICIEANSAFKLFTDSLHLRQGLAGLGVRYVQRVSGGQGEAEKLAVGQLAGLFTTNMISLPVKGYSRALLADFVNQFVRYDPDDKSRPKDIVKALQMAEHAVKALDHAPIQRKHDHTMPPYLRRQRYVRQVG